MLQIFHLLSQAVAKQKNYKIFNLQILFNFLYAGQILKIYKEKVIGVYANVQLGLKRTCIGSCSDGSHL
jgi:hypothetical protein